MVFVMMLVSALVNHCTKVQRAIALDQFLAVIMVCATTEYANATETLVVRFVRSARKITTVQNAISSVIHLEPL